MTTAEVNKYIHTQIMGKCWHKEGECRGHPDGKCSLCGVTIYTDQNPDYCSDSSPRSLLHAILATLDSDIAISGAVSGTNLPTFRCNAEQLARACVEVHQGDGQWRQRKLRSHEKKI